MTKEQELKLDKSCKKFDICEEYFVRFSNVNTPFGSILSGMSQKLSTPAEEDSRMGSSTDFAAKGCTAMRRPSNKAPAKIVLVALISLNSVSTSGFRYVGSRQR